MESPDERESSITFHRKKIEEKVADLMMLKHSIYESET